MTRRFVLPILFILPIALFGAVRAQASPDTGGGGGCGDGTCGSGESCSSCPQDCYCTCNYCPYGSCGTCGSSCTYNCNEAGGCTLSGPTLCHSGEYCCTGSSSCQYMGYCQFSQCDAYKPAYTCSGRRYCIPSCTSSGWTSSCNCVVGQCGATCDSDSDCGTTACYDQCSGSYSYYDKPASVSNICSTCACASGSCPTGTLTSCGTQTCTDVCDNPNNQFKNYVPSSCSKTCVDVSNANDYCANCCPDPGWTSCGTNSRTCTAGQNCACEDYAGGKRLRCDTGDDKSCNRGCTSSGCNLACTPPVCDRQWLESDSDEDGYFGSCDICETESELTDMGDPDYQAAETSCSDGIDNDCDGKADLNDPDCACTEALASAGCATLSAAKIAASLAGCDWCTECSSIGEGTWTISPATNAYTPNQYYAAYGTGACMARGACTNYTCVTGMCGSGCTVQSIEDQDAGELGECDDAKLPDSYVCNNPASNNLTDVYSVYNDYQCDVGVDCGCYDAGTTYQRFDETRCMLNQCRATCDADAGCEPTVCDDNDGCWGYDGTWRKGCELGDTYCTYFGFGNVPNTCGLAGSCACSSNQCSPPPSGCNPFTGACDSTYRTADRSDRDYDGWSDPCDGLFLSIPNQSMTHLELYPFERFAVKGYATFSPNTAMTSCDEPWMIDESWNRSASGDWRLGCQTGAKMEADFLWSAPFAAGTPYYYELFLDKGTNSRCDFSHGEFRHFDFIGCDQSAVHYWDEAQMAQTGLGDPALDGTPFSVLSPVFWYNDVALSFSVSEGLGTNSGKFRLQGTVDELLNLDLKITTKCMVSFGTEMMTVLKESPDALDSDPLSETSAIVGGETDWTENLGTSKQIQPWDHLLLLYTPAGGDFTLELRANDFLSDLYLDDLLVTAGKVSYCSEGECYCEHFAENCAKVQDEAAGRTIRIDLGRLSPGFHKLKFKVVDVWSKGFATGIKLLDSSTEAAAPKYTCSQATTGASTNFECMIEPTGIANHEFCMRPQHVGCLSYIDDPDNNPSTVFDNVLQAHMYVEFMDCPQTCVCDPDDDYYLNTLTGYCESLCCPEWPCPGCCDDRCATPQFIQ